MKNTKMMSAALCGIFICLIVGYFAVRADAFGFGSSIARNGEVGIDESAYYKVSHVYDGDTFTTDVNGWEITVRMLGINTPETVDPRKPVQCYGPEASAETKALLGGQSVRLVANPDRERRDKYGRYLLYVYRKDGLFINEYLIQQGFAREYTVGKPYQYQKLFRDDEAAAKAASKGLWGKCEPK